MIALWVLACADGSPGTDRAGGVVTPKDATATLEICINEFMPDNETVLPDETGAFPDWIELMNPRSPVAVSLAGWSLGDERGDAQKLDASLEVPAGGALVLFADDRAELGPHHLPFKLSADGGELALYAPDGRGSVVTYGFTADDFAVKRATDCCESGACFEHVWRGSPGESNPH